MNKHFSLLPVFLCVPLVSLADNFEPHASYNVCFTPKQNCTAKIVGTIDSAVKDIRVQAYSFTSSPIVHALVTAQERGVNVKVIMDKSALTQYQRTANYLANHKIPVWIDKRPAIAHNKVMVIDQTQVITGSFNFTKAAQFNNAENLLIINDAGLAKKYLQNWQSRQQVSKPYNSVATEQLPDQANWLGDLWEQFLQWLRSL